MKRLSTEQRIYSIRVTALRTGRKLRKKPRRSKTVLRSPEWDYIIRAPEVFTLQNKDHRKLFLHFINSVKQCCMEGSKRIRIDFSQTYQMVTDGSLLFRAHMCRIYSNKPSDTVIKCRYSHSKKINEVLKQIEIFDLLEQNPKITPTHPDVIHWRYAQGAGALGEKYEDILGSYDGSITRVLREGLYLGLTEAMTNTRQHAYPSNNSGVNSFINTDNEWWMFSQEKDGRLSVVFCDLGIGIPNSLPIKKPSLWKKIKVRLGESPDDSGVIMEAIQDSKSRTGEKYRGKGLKQLTGILESTEGGQLYLHSNHGCYTAANGYKNLIEYNDSIFGTLISWSIPISTTEGSGYHDR